MLTYNCGMAKKPPDPLTTEQAAAILGTSKRIVQRLIAQGRLKAKRFGKQWAVYAEDLEAVRDRPVGNPMFTRRKR